MGCFFTCFRVKEDDDRAQLPRSIRYQKPPEAVVSRNPLQALFLSDGNEDSPCKDGESLVYGSPLISKELRDEGKFLKACGTLQETPNEIRKASNWPMASSTEGRDSENSKFHSWLPVSSIERLQLELNKELELSPTPLRLSDKYGEGSNSAEHTASSCMLDNQNTGTSSISSSEGSRAFRVQTTSEAHKRQNDSIATALSPSNSALNAQCRNKSVRFECDVDGSWSRDSTSEMASQSVEESESPGIQNTSNAGPHPTPMKLTEEMQTPGTVFPAYMETLLPQNARIRSEYVHSVLNPVQSTSQWKSLMDGECNCNLLLDELKDTSEQPGSTREKSEMHIEETSARKESKVETSLSSWLKPPQNKWDDDDHKFRAVASKKSQFCSTPGDRPIIGLVAAHWNENETQTLPKWWDGNGIPNSTNKYKEDQKVSWHATPFEERLEKALSEESSISQRNQPQGLPITFERDEESDTALSHFRNSAHSESVVSF
ncbi:protein JASON isoform X2 [Rhodamnia argentea]|uniref:Protein JASON isoform X2 n=1 Tax=Rhodamnia argentea TaxID=178133 RepID=A0A8B8NAB0_9MYRT|nr:protein JASON isoform X2 [Rhodamnia argentea]